MSTDSSHRAKLIACFATVYLVWGSTYLVASIGVHELPPLLFGGIRFMCAGVLLGLTSLALGNRFTLDLVGSVIRDNTAHEGGSAIFFVSNDRTGELRITDSTLQRNTGDRFGTPGYPGIFFLGLGAPQLTRSSVS